jgi:Arc/MetJ-type ribon-helix-helix transcriptional regulator
MPPTRKVTVELPRELLRKAQRTTGSGITATIRRGLELVAASRACQELRQLKGKVALSIDLEKLREDR